MASFNIYFFEFDIEFIKDENDSLSNFLTCESLQGSQENWKTTTWANWSRIIFSKHAEALFPFS